jgi:hypothetical protein
VVVVAVVAAAAAGTLVQLWRRDFERRG